MVCNTQLCYIKYGGLLNTIEDPAFCIENIPAYIEVEELGPKSLITCVICGDKCSLSKMRNHVGKHIMRLMLDIPEDAVNEKVNY